MTKGKKSGKVKSSSVVDGLSTEEMTKDQLEEHIVRLREELDREREERSYFQLERDKIMAFWEISKRDLEEVKSDLRNRRRERGEAEEQHRVEISVYKQKLKHVLSEHHSIVSELKMDGVAAFLLTQKQQTDSEMRLCRETNSRQVDFREKTIQCENRIKELKLRHQVELLELTKVYERKMREIEVKHKDKMVLLGEEQGRKRRDDVIELEDRMRSRAVALMKDHNKHLELAEDYYKTFQDRALHGQKMLRAELESDWRKHEQVDKQLSAAQRENEHLRQSLREAEQKVPELRQRLDKYQQEKAKATAVAARLKLTEKELRDLTVEHELLLQAFEKAEQERDALLKTQTEAILDVQQKSGLEELLLQRKMAALTRTVETKEAQLCGILSTSHLDPMAGSVSANKLQETLESKQVAISALQDNLAWDCKEYNDLLLACQDGLKALSVPLYDFPFSDAETILNRVTAQR